MIAGKRKVKRAMLTTEKPMKLVITMEMKPSKSEIEMSDF